MRSQSGYTLIELLAASAATAVIIAAGTGFMLKALAWYDDLSGRIEINRHARESYDLLAFGGKSAALGKDGTHNVYGLRGSNKAPPNGLRSNGALQYTNNKLTLTPDQFSPVTIVCSGSGVPIPDCKSNKGPGATQTIKGWIGSDVTLDAGAKSVNNQTVAVSLTVTNPLEAQRAFSPSQFTDTYNAIFSLNRNEDDPH